MEHYALSPVTRRTALKTGLALAAASVVGGTARADQDARAGAELAHAEIWRRFFDRHDVMIDFTNLDGSVDIPTPDECREGKPNALGWWSPIENGAMFNGQFMDGAVARWRNTRDAADAAQARRLMEGLLFLNSISDVRGFVGRGVSTDGRSHYPMGSNDQSLPWFYGLWRYLDSDLATKEERSRISARLRETAEVIERLKWQMPAEQPFGVRGGFGGFSFESSPRLLFVCKLMHGLTGDSKWDTLYRDALAARGGKQEQLSRREYCERGMVFEHGGRHSWTSACGVISLRALWEMEQDAELKTAYARGLQASATLALASLPLAAQFDANDATRFEPNWRIMNETWKPQRTETEAQELAEAQLRAFGKISTRRGKETQFVREPVYAAWIVTLAPDREILRQRAADVERVIACYPYDKLFYSQFFPVEAAYWRLQS